MCEYGEIWISDEHKYCFQGYSDQSLKASAVWLHWLTPLTETVVVSLFKKSFCLLRMEDYDGEEVDEEALIEQRRQQRLAIVQVCAQ